MKKFILELKMFTKNNIGVELSYREPFKVLIIYTIYQKLPNNKPFFNYKNSYILH